MNSTSTTDSKSASVPAVPALPTPVQSQPQSCHTQPSHHTKQQSYEYTHSFPAVSPQRKGLSPETTALAKQVLRFGQPQNDDGPVRPVGGLQWISDSSMDPKPSAHRKGRKLSTNESAARAMERAKKRRNVEETHGSHVNKTEGATKECQV